MKQINKNLKNDIILYGLILLIILITIIAYLYMFGSYGLSSNNDVWGTFGDYFGGILNPIIGILNIAVFIYLTRTISDIDAKNQNNAIEMQKNLFKLDLKHQAYNEIAKLLTDLPEYIMHNDPSVALTKLTKYNNQFFNLSANYSYLFPILDKNNTKPIFKITSDLQEKMNIAVKVSDEIKKKNMFNDIAMKFDYGEFLNQKNILLKKLQKDLID